MSAPGTGELAGRAERLRQLSAGVNTENVLARIQQGLAELGELLGDPGALESAAVAFTQAGAALRQIGADTATDATSRLHAAWTGQAAVAAGERTGSAGRGIWLDSAVFDATASVLESLGGRLRDAQRSHEDLRQYLIDLSHRAALLPAVEPVDPGAGADLVRLVGESLAAGAALLGQVRNDHDTAAAHFANRMAILVAFGGLAGGLSGDPLGAQPADPLVNIRRPLHEIFQTYQVTPDPDGLVMYPEGVTGWLTQQLGVPPTKLTASEARMLDNLGLLGVKDARDIQITAQTTALSTFGRVGELDGHTDAFRHAYWNALLTQRFDEGWTSDFTTAHERRPNNLPHAEAMDLHNNEVGRHIARENPDASPEELASLVEQAVREGQTVVIDQDDNLAYSDQIPIGQTGTAPEIPQPPGTEPSQPDGTRWSGGYHPGSGADDGYTTSGDY
ncbi:MAG: hypothetical protein ABR608_01875 [Pseudonocardiaceae bacterium]